ncbi:MAG: S8 family serine peptidase [Aeriscardovia sp.]|nr:S8 family serine peptidase [Aeriscardovia sp.]
MKNSFLILTMAILTVVLNSCEDAYFPNEFGSESEIMNELKDVVSTSSQANECYYWFHGDKKIIKETTKKRFLLFDTGVKEFKESNLCNKLEKELQEISFPGMEYVDYNELDQKRIKYLVVDEEKFKQIQQDGLRGVVYFSNFYTSSSDEFGISHLFYVKLKKESDVEKLQKIAKDNNVSIIGYNKYLPLWYTLSCSTKSKGNAIQMANKFYEVGDFEASEPDVMLSNLFSSNVYALNDTYYGNQWNLHGQYSINWESAHALSNGSGVSVAIFDCGIEQLHPDFNFGYGLMGFDTVDQGYDSGNYIYNQQAHGTACAGIIKATAGNGIGVAGIAPQSTIYSVCNPFDGRPNTLQELALGLIDASNCDIISCSWGCSESTMIEDALNYYCFSWGRNGKGCIVVFATGNSNYSTVSFPANCDERILAVGASNTSGQKCSFSNYGTSLDVVAPGTNIPTTDLLGGWGYDSGNYTMNFDGTSAACPHVAGIAALVLSVNPSLTRAQVNEIIQSTARKVGGYNYSNTQGKTDGTWNIRMGYGLVDAYAAVLEAIQRL